MAFLSRKCGAASGVVRRGMVLGGLAWAVGAGAQTLDSGPEVPEAARRLVSRQHLGNGLRRMALAVATGTMTYGMLRDRLGSQPASSTVTREIDRLVPRYQQVWDKELARSYAQHFTPQELASLAEQGRDSPYLSQLVQKQPVVGADMQSRAASIVRDLVSEALRNAWDTVAVASP